MQILVGWERRRPAGQRDNRSVGRRPARFWPAHRRMSAVTPWPLPPRGTGPTVRPVTQPPRTPSLAPTT